VAEGSRAEGKDLTHDDPVWRDRSDFIIGIELPEDGVWEQLWARRLTDDTFEICCIPFFAYDLALGDVVQTASANGKDYAVQRVTRPSGRFVFRVWLGDSSQPREEVAAQLRAMGGVVEWSSVNLLAVDAADGNHAQTIADWLHERELAGDLVYETGKTG
jgi:hypothetical protein